MVVNLLDASPLLDIRVRPMSVGLTEAKVPNIVFNIKCYLMINNSTLV